MDCAMNESSQGGDTGMDQQTLLLLQSLLQEDWIMAVTTTEEERQTLMLAHSLQQEEWDKEDDISKTSKQDSTKSLSKRDDNMVATNDDTPTTKTSTTNEKEAPEALQQDVTTESRNKDESDDASNSQKKYHRDEFESEALLLQTPVGRALKLVERLILLWHARPQWHPYVRLLGRDDIVFLAECLIHLQKLWKSVHANNISQRSARVDVGYHWTRPENLDRIRTNGLLTKKERDMEGIQSRHNGSRYGEGVYTADNPHNFYKKYGPVCLMVARMMGVKGRRTGNDWLLDTVVDSANRMAVLKFSNQCFPIFSFHESLLDPQQTKEGNNIILQCHTEVQRILDEFLNDGIETPVTLVFPRSFVPTQITVPASQLTSTAVSMQNRRVNSSFRQPPPQKRSRDLEISHITPMVKNRTVHAYFAPEILHASQGKSPTARMSYFRDDDLTCQGYKKGTIVVTYMIHKGNQRPFHPNPGALHDSLQRLAFLPDNEDGNALLKRLEQAFLGGWMFEVKTHRFFPNAPNSVDWVIPHKTLLATGLEDVAYTEKIGSANCGFPDDMYFDRANAVLDRLVLDKVV